MKTDLSRFDPYQLEIITENSGRNIVVGASAGAGKTMVLVARMMKRCLEDRVSIDRILALTFTAAAAEEMKNRLSRQFHDLLAKCDDPDEKEYINKQISLLVTADITTIDSYCLDIIRRFCSTIGMDPATSKNILSEGKNELLKKEAFRLSLSEMAEGEEGFTKMLRLTEYFSSRPENYTNLYEAVCNINTHAASSVDPHEWYAHCRETYGQFATLKQLPPMIKDAWFDYLERECAQIIEYAAAIKERLAEEPEKKISGEMIVQTLNLMNHCLMNIQQNDYDGYLALLKEAAVNKIPKAADSLTESLRTGMHEKISSLLEVSYEQSSFAANSALQEEIICSLTQLAEKTADRFTELKKELPAMDFSDMERYALEILRANHGRIAKKLNHSFDEIMIDEFQDTSYLQDTILREIAEADRKIPVFRVGDVKQSIYRFRQAKPQLMRSLMEDEETAVFNMRYNYRSHEGIVAFTNLLFSRLMNVEGIHDSYGPKDNVEAGSPQQKTPRSDAPVTLILLDPPDPPDPEAKMTAGDAKAYKASYISQKICEMIAESNGELKFSDFAVLSRSHGDQIVLRRFFDLYHIPYDIDSREGFYRSDLCRDILNIARLLQNPKDEIALAAVATSPLFSLSDQDLADAMKLNRGFADGLYEQHPEINELFLSYSRILKHNGIQALLTAIANTPVKDSRIPDEAVLYDVLSKKDQANFDYLYDLSVSAGLYDLPSLIHEIEEGEAENSSEAVTSGKGDDVVTVTTIHHSKGLQYPIVFLWGTSGNTFNDASKSVLVDDELMLGIRDIDPEYRIALPTIQRILVQDRCSREDIEEFTRVLYVAITRAQNKLIVVDLAKAAEDKTPVIDLAALSERNGITGLMTAALEHEEGLNENGLLEVRHIIHEADPYQYRYLTDHLRAESVKSLPRLQFEPEILPAIKTPSSLEKSRSMLNAEETHPVLPPFAKKNTGGSQYGTLMHKACEDMPDDQEWTEELIRSVMDPSLGEKALKDLYAFGHSDLYRRCTAMEIHKEYPFYYESEDARINGTIDFAAIGEKEIVVIDFKTDNLTPEEIKEEYAPQLRTYRDVMQSFYPDHKIELYAWSFHNGTEVPVE